MCIILITSWSSVCGKISYRIVRTNDTAQIMQLKGKQQIKYIHKTASSDDIDN